MSSACIKFFKLMEVFSMSMFQDSKYWIGVCTLDLMFSDWRSRIDVLLQVPFAYAIHLLEPGMDHVHVVLAFPTITGYKHAISTFNLLSPVGFSCCPLAQSVSSLTPVCDYLIRHTGSLICRGNGFDLLCQVRSSN